ncbi:ThiS family protein [Thalassoglobus neptunius]|uniref:ThiS family protein n=1 Tax=Thalassoglobus neptunius TaxID=1938619 RepID=A0A5C5WPD1_9PLAN|nr:MoaD/ThiS family protein [Thalassoglobus neptunius]TWT51863.1 ThiS family protein [Thalassoglobus neptunius]
MSIRVQFEAQLRECSGVRETTVEADSISLRDLFVALGQQFGQDFCRRILDDQQQPRRSLLVFVNDASVTASDFETRQLNSDDVVTLYPPISGG